MYKDRDFNDKVKLPFNSSNLINDLGLETIFQAMSNGDEFIYEIAKVALLDTLREKEEIVYRQEVLKDCINNEQIVKDIYALTLKSIEKKHENLLGIFGRFPGSLLSSSVSLLDMYFDILKELREITSIHKEKFISSGFERFFTMVEDELNDEYIKNVKEHLKELRFKKGVLISAKLGYANEGINYTLRRDKYALKNWIGKVFSKKSKEYSYTLHPRDDAGANILRNIRDEALYDVALSLSHSAKHVDNFFKLLRKELAFYLGCINLYKTLNDHKCQTTFPIVWGKEEFKLSIKGVYDISLALILNKEVISNDLKADKKKLIIITGANQGGKTTFLRSIGISYLMMQSGMFVPAKLFEASISSGVFTHFKKEEDKTLKSGKFNEELLRMSQIIEHIHPNALILFNESFASTNEFEGSQIAKNIILALLKKDIRVFFVTHMYELSDYFYQSRLNNTLFLRANRNEDGKRDFKILLAPPLQTSFAKDLYDKIMKN